jgi:hypothetical protein
MAADGDGGKGGGGGVSGGLNQIRIRVEQVLSKFSGTPLSYPYQKKTAQNDMTAETALKPALKIAANFLLRPPY